MAEASHLIAAAFIVGIFFLSLVFVEVSRLQHALEEAQITQTFEEASRLEESFDSLLKMTEPKTNETIGEILANCSFYGEEDINYGEHSVNCLFLLEELFDGFYGKENYYLEMPVYRTVFENPVEISFIVDTSGSMGADLVMVGKAVSFLDTRFPGDLNFFIYTLVEYAPPAGCELPNVTCQEIPKDDLEELCFEAGLQPWTSWDEPGNCSLDEAYGLGIGWWSEQHPADSNATRIVIPVSDELSCSCEVFDGDVSIGLGGPEVSEKSIDLGLEYISDHINTSIYPMLCTPDGVNPPDAHFFQNHNRDWIVHDMNRLAQIGPGEIIDFYYGYDEHLLAAVLERIILERVPIKEESLEIGTRKEEAERHSFERTVLKPDKEPVNFTLWLYKDRVPHDPERVVVRFPPIAIINANPRNPIDPPYNVTLDGRASYSPSGFTIESYEWEIDGSVVSNESHFTYEFTSKGRYTVKLTVTDSEGMKGSTTLTIMVGEEPKLTLVFVPVNWQGSNAAFEKYSKDHYEVFIRGAELQACESDYELIILQPSHENCNINELKQPINYRDTGRTQKVLTKIKSCAALSGHPIGMDSIAAGITNQDIKISFSRGVVGNVLGFTWFEYNSVLSNHAWLETTAHELGHQFYFCEQYNESDWHSQNEQLIEYFDTTCANHYPDGSNRCPEYGDLTTHCPEFFGPRVVDCHGRKIPIGSQVGRSLMGPGLSLSDIEYRVPVSLREFDCFEKEVIQNALECR